MGITDLDRLNQIATYANSFPSFNFTMDTDTKNSINCILIDEYGHVIKSPITKTVADNLRKDGYRPFVPDLLDIKNKMIIEFQEESTPWRGSKIIKKGHDEFSDEDKDLYYQLAKFHQLKIWESDKFWTDKIDSFLTGTTSL